MRILKGFPMFTLALLSLAVSFIPVAATAQTVPVANGYNFRLVTNSLYGDFVPADGFDGFCPVSSTGRFAEIDLLLPDGRAFLLANQQGSFNSGNGGGPIFFNTTRNGIGRGGHACGLNDALFFTFEQDPASKATLWDLRLGDDPKFGSYRKIVGPGDTFNYSGGSATYLDGFTITANYGRTILTGSFDRGFGPRTLVFELFAGSAPHLLADLGSDQSISASLTANMVYVQTINVEHSSIAITAVPRNGNAFAVSQLDGLTSDDLAGFYSNREIEMSSNRTTAVWTIRDNGHLLIQKLVDGQTTPVTVFEGNQVDQYQVARVGSIAIAESGDIYFEMQTLVPADEKNPRGGQESIYRINTAGQLVRVMTEGVDISRIGSSWKVFANTTRVLANRGLETYEIILSSNTARRTEYANHSAK